MQSDYLCGFKSATFDSSKFWHGFETLEIQESSGNILFLDSQKWLGCKENNIKYNFNRVCEALEPRLGHSLGSLSQFLQHGAARSISTSPGRDASPSQVTSPQFARFPQQCAATHLYTWVERGIVRVKCLAQGHQQNVPGQYRLSPTCLPISRVAKF